MADGSGGGRVVLMAVIGVVAFAAGAATVSMVVRTEAPPAAAAGEPRAAPGGTPSQATLEHLRSSYDKLAEGHADLQRRLDQANRELDDARARLAAAQPAVQPEPAPAAKAAKSDADASTCVVQAVDNKNDIFVISIGTKDGVEQGMEFEVRHGDEAVGSIVVDKVFPNYASGFRKPGAKSFSVQAGDVCVRVASAK